MSNQVTQYCILREGHVAYLRCLTWAQGKCSVYKTHSAPKPVIFVMSGVFQELSLSLSKPTCSIYFWQRENESTDIVTISKHSYFDHWFEKSFTLSLLSLFFLLYLSSLYTFSILKHYCNRDLYDWLGRASQQSCVNHTNTPVWGEESVGWVWKSVVPCSIYLHCYFVNVTWDCFCSWDVKKIGVPYCASNILLDMRIFPSDTITIVVGWSRQKQFCIRHAASESLCCYSVSLPQLSFGCCVNVFDPQPLSAWSD